MKLVLFALLMLCSLGCATTRPQAVANPNGLGETISNNERNSIVIEVYVKGKGDQVPKPVYRFTKRAGMLDLIGEPTVVSKVVASDDATSATTYVAKTKKALTTAILTTGGAIAGGSTAGAPGAAVGAGVGNIAGKTVEKILPSEE